MSNETSYNNFTNEADIQQSVAYFYARLFVFSGMIISVVVIPTHLFLLYVTDNVETAKGKNFMALMSMLLMKYLLILLNNTLGTSLFVSFPSAMIFGLIYVHLSATCWLCIITEHSLNIIKRTIWKSYNVRWISVSVCSVLGWMLPIFFVLLAYLFAIAATDQFCEFGCVSCLCQAKIFYVVFELITFALLIKSSVNVIRVKYYTFYTIPTEMNVENVVSEFDYTNFGLMVCLIFYISGMIEIVYFLRTTVIVYTISVANSVEAILIVIATLWWKKIIFFKSAS